MSNPSGESETARNSITNFRPESDLCLGRANVWQLRTSQLGIGARPLVMGIVNVTPDSFSDGGCWFNEDAAIEHGLSLASTGADILDIGGESTRPYSQPVTEQEEIARVIPVINELAKRTSIPISIDTSKFRVAAAAISAGAEIINDVTALRGDPAMLDLVRESGAAVCAMHMQGTPQTMQDNPQYVDLVGEIYQYLEARLHELLDQGISRQKICLDPGIGFGKSHEHNRLLVQNVRRFLSLGQPILIGHSRKGFIGKLLEDPGLDRDTGTLGVSLFLASQGVQILRVHDVARTCQALKTFCALHTFKADHCGN